MAAVPSVAIVICRSGWDKKLRKLLADKLAVVHHEDASIHGALIRVEVGGSNPGRRSVSVSCATRLEAAWAL